MLWPATDCKKGNTLKMLRKCFLGTFLDAVQNGEKMLPKCSQYSKKKSSENGDTVRVTILGAFLQSLQLMPGLFYMSVKIIS